jgi:hypothetical protein
MGYNTDIFGRLKSNKRIEGEAYNRIMNLHDTLDFPPEVQEKATWERYCQWVVSEDGFGIEWDKQEKFYYFVEWLEIIIDYALKPYGYTLSGKLQCVGEERGDISTITVRNNEVVFHQFNDDEVAQYYHDENIRLKDIVGEMTQITQGKKIWSHSMSSLEKARESPSDMYFILNKRPDGTHRLYNLEEDSLCLEQSSNLDLEYFSYLEIDSITGIYTYPEGLYEWIFNIPSIITIEYIDSLFTYSTQSHMHIYIPPTTSGRNFLQELYKLTDVKCPLTVGYTPFIKFIAPKLFAAWLLGHIGIPMLIGVGALIQMRAFIYLAIYLVVAAYALTTIWKWFWKTDYGKLFKNKKELPKQA